MAEPPKILQVTYGAFSCTLEGFEDPVEALIAVADYIRGLRADDPLFAGEVRLPGAEELGRRIAEAPVGAEGEVRIDLGPLPEAGAAGGGRGPDGPAGEAPAQDGDEAGEPRTEAVGGAPGGHWDGEDADVQPGIGVRMDHSLDDEARADGPLPDGRTAAPEPLPEAGPDSGGAPAVPEPAERAAPRPEALLDYSWLDDEEDADERPAPRPAPDPGEARVAVDLAQLAMALSVRRSPAPTSEPEAPAPPAAAAPAPEVADAPEPVPELLPPPPQDTIAAGAYDWGVGEEDDWFVSGAAVQPGPITMAPDPSSPGRRWLLGQSPDQDETILLRILSRAESKLADPEAQRRREAMAHLKAAVAATEAERALDDVSPDEEAPGAVQPAAVAGAADPADEQPNAAPLRLVASQRVDLPRMRAALRGLRPRARPFEEEADWALGEAARPPSVERPAAEAPGRAPAVASAGVTAAPVVPPAPEPVVPAAEPIATAEPEAAVEPLPAVPDPEPSEAAEASRPPEEVAAVPPAEPAPLPAALDEDAGPVRPGADGGFAAFAAAQGATALPALLEAAAAWATQRSPAGEATRSELVALASEALAAEPPREEVLRVIGILLREGRLLKGQGGRFRAAPGTRGEPGRAG